MALTDEERAALEAEMRQQLEEEHAQRLRQLEERRASARARREARGAGARQVAVTELQQELRERFYKEKGYRLYTDSTGREVWLTPEEFAVRSRRRKERKRPMHDQELGQRRIWYVYGAIAVLAVVLGALLAH